jgi:predicted dehydrogenase
MKNIQVAVIGAGYWGPNLVRNFYRIPGTTVKMVADLSDEALTSIKNQYPQVEITHDAKQIALDPTIDLVAVATPVVTHFNLARMMLENRKNILVEKPISKTIAETQKLITLAKKVDRMLFVGHTYVYNHAVRAIKKLVDHQTMGKLYYYDSIRINTMLVRNDVNVIWDLAPHDFSILTYLFNEKPVSLQAFGSGREVDKYEIAHLLLHYRSGMTAHIHVSWLSPVKLRKILIGGANKMIMFDDLEPSEKLKIYDASQAIFPKEVTPFSPAWRSGDVTIPRLAETEALYEELKYCVDCVRNKKSPITDGNMGLEVVKLLDASDRSLSQKSEIRLI